jgi:hypothetical protein
MMECGEMSSPIGAEMQRHFLAAKAVRLLSLLGKTKPRELIGYLALVA